MASQFQAYSLTSIILWLIIHKLFLNITHEYTLIALLLFSSNTFKNLMYLNHRPFYYSCTNTCSKWSLISIFAHLFAFHIFCAFHQCLIFEVFYSLSEQSSPMITKIKYFTFNVINDISSFTNCFEIYLRRKSTFFINSIQMLLKNYGNMPVWYETCQNSLKHLSQKIYGFIND